MEIWREKAHLKIFNPYVRNCMWIFRKEESSILKYTSKTKCRGFKEGKEHLAICQRENWGNMSPWLTLSLPLFLIFHFLWSILFLTCLLYRGLGISLKYAEGQNFKIEIVPLAGGCLRQHSSSLLITIQPQCQTFPLMKWSGAETSRLQEHWGNTQLVRPSLVSK